MNCPLSRLKKTIREGGCQYLSSPQAVRRPGCPLGLPRGTDKGSNFSLRNKGAARDGKLHRPSEMKAAENFSGWRSRMVRGQKLDPVGTQKNLKGKSVSENRKGTNPVGK